jgi:hypothetical protein
MRRIVVLAVFIILLGQLCTLVSLFPVAKAEEFRDNERIDRDVGKGTRTNPSIEVSDGNIYTVWQDNRTGPWDVYYSKSSNNGTSFLQDVRVNDNPSDDGTDQRYPDIVAHNGSVYAVWQDERSGMGRSEIFFSRSSDGYSFGPNIRISGSGTDERSPSIAVDDNSGHIYVAWASWEREIRLARSVDGGESFESSVLVCNPWAAETRNPAVAVDSTGKVYVVWSDARAGPTPPYDFDVFISSSTDFGQSFGPDFTVHEIIVDTVQYNPSISIDANDVVYVVWEDERFGDPVIFFAKSSDGSNFGPNVMVNNPYTHRKTPYVTHRTPSIAVHPSGNPIFVAWTDDRGDNHNVYLAKSTDGGNSFYTATSEFGGNFFFDKDLPFNGAHNSNEAVILDDGNGILDPGVLDGSESPDRIVASGLANLEYDLWGLSIRFCDMNDNQAWDRVEDIVMDMPATRYSGIKLRRTYPLDSTTGNFITYLRYDLRNHNDSKYYTVEKGQRMAVGWFDLAREGLKEGDPITNVEIEVAYKTDDGYDGNNFLTWSLSYAGENPFHQVVDTHGVEVYETVDLFPLGVDTVEKLIQLNISSVNDASSNLNVSFNSMSLEVFRGYVDGFDIHDVLAYDGPMDSTPGKPLSDFSRSDNLMFIDANGTGFYERGEPLVITDGSDAGDLINESFEVLPRGDNPHWNAAFEPFPLNDDIGSNHQESPDIGLDSVGNPYVVWGDARPASDGIYFTTNVFDVFPPEVLYSYPQNSALNVSLEATISIVFNEPMQVDAPSKVTIIPHTQGFWFWNGYRTNMTLVPYLPLISNTTYTITIEDAKDKSGNVLSSAYTFQFRTVEAPVFLHVPPSGTLTIGEPIEILAMISDNDSIADVTLYYLNVGEVSLSQVKMDLASGSPINGSWNASIPAQIDIGFVFYYIVAEDPFGNIGRSPVVGRHNLLIIDDTSPSLTHTAIQTATAGSKLTFTATATDDLEILKVKLYVKPVGAQYFNPPLLMERVGSTDEFRYEINLANVDGEMHYYIEVVDKWGNTAYSGSLTSPHKVAITGAPLDMGAVLPWTLIFVSIAFLYVGMFIVRRGKRKERKETSEEEG